MHRLLFIYLQNIIPLHVSSHKCSSSGGYIVYMQHMVLSLPTRAHGGLSVHSSHSSCVPTGHHELSQRVTTICCMYTMYPPEDEHLWLETCRGVIFCK